MTADPTSSSTDGDTAIRQTVTITNQRGLHARASAKFVKCLEPFDVEFTVSREGMSVSGTSIMGLMMLAAHTGCDIALEASGPEAEKAMAAIVELIEAKFDED